MDLNEELCRGDLFYDFVVPKLEGVSSGLTPVAFIDSVDYINSVTDTNNNPVNEDMSAASTSTVNPIKSFIDEMLFSDSSMAIPGPSGHLGGSNEALDGIITAEELNNATASLGLLGQFGWSSDGSTTDGTTVSSPETDTHWLAQGDGTPITLTNLLDPIFVTYADPDEDSPVEGEESKATKYYTNEVVSSDLITSTFPRCPDKGMNHRVLANDMSPSDMTITWAKQISPDSQQQFTNSADSSMLLRTALEGGPKCGQLSSILTFKSNACATTTHSNTFSHNTKTTEMVELRKVLSYPPITFHGAHVQGHHSPTSTSSNPNHSHLLLDQSEQGPPYYEVRILEDAMFTTNHYILPDDEANIPNVEELIMTHIDQSQPNKKPHLVFSDSDRKIHSTTAPLSTKWSYTTLNPQNITGGGGHGEMKVIRRRKKRNSDGEACQSSSAEMYMSLGSPSSQNSRKERSLHHCSICNKGFKDKYSVTVHIRTHTGEKPFSCSLCGKNFRQKAHLAKHYQTHAAKANAQAAKSGQVKR